MVNDLESFSGLTIWVLLAVLKVFLFTHFFTAISDTSVTSFIFYDFTHISAMGQQDFTIIKTSLILTFKAVEVQMRKAFKA